MDTEFHVTALFTSAYEKAASIATAMSQWVHSERLVYGQSIAMSLMTPIFLSFLLYRPKLLF